MQGQAVARGGQAASPRENSQCCGDRQGYEDPQDCEDPQGCEDRRGSGDRQGGEDPGVVRIPGLWGSPGLWIVTNASCQVTSMIYICRALWGEGWYNMLCYTLRHLLGWGGADMGMPGTPRCLFLISILICCVAIGQITEYLMGRLYLCIFRHG